MANDKIKDLAKEMTTKEIIALIDAHLEYLGEKEIKVNLNLGDSVIMGNVVRVPKDMTA